MDGRLYHLPFGGSSVSLNGTIQSGKSQQSYVPFALRDDGGLHNSQAHISLNEHGPLFQETKEHLDDPDWDSDSDLSGGGTKVAPHAYTLGQLQEEGPYPPEECWESLASDGSKRPHPHDNILSKQYWPGEYVTTASDSEGQAGADRLKVECLELGPTWDKRGVPDEMPGEQVEGSGKDNVMIMPSLSNVNAHPHRGILKKKQLSPIAERNGIKRIHNELSANAPGHASSSESTGGGAKPSLSDQLNGVALSIKAGTIDGDSSGSDPLNNSV
ncbi:hypothetical protein UPYG_G00170150 [Umbra pygmaea]|uniref:Uncharacterized protein n=1 Tax=Umbra pygmaea TaxID=75934 RepID=A0ABD0WTG7_UMBPY